MSSPGLDEDAVMHDAAAAELPAATDDPMDGAEDGEEGEGDDLQPTGDLSDDSSQEEDEDEDALQKIRDGFIVDEDEEDADEDEDDEEQRRRKRRKRRHRRRREEEDLEEDDLDLLEENTGESFKKKHRLTRLRRGGRDSESPPAAAVSSSSRRKGVVQFEDDDDLDEPVVRNDITAIWDDDRGREDDEEEEDMDDFIESDEEDGDAMDDNAREERRRQKRREDMERRKARTIHPELAGIDAAAWEEIHDIFGDGHDYDWALEDDEVEHEELKSDMRYHDVFEPSEIRARMLTEDDDLIRARDTPERMQLTTSALSSNQTLSVAAPLDVEDLSDAANWATPQISAWKSNEYLSFGGSRGHLKGDLIAAVVFVLGQLFIEEYEVPFIWAHKRDYFTHVDKSQIPHVRTELLSQPDLWRIYALGQKYRSLIERKRALAASFSRLNIEDKYFEEEVQPKIVNAEMVTDAIEWLTLKYKQKKDVEEDEFRFHDDEVAPATKKHKMPSRMSAYEVAKKSIISRLAAGYGITSHQVVMNFLAGVQLHFVEDQELPPVVFAEGFVDPDPSKAVPADDLLKRSRMINATELGKDPVLREQIREAFREDALISVLPTERGVTKIDEQNPAFNHKYLSNKKITDMLESSQFLAILASEAEHLVTVDVQLAPEAKAQFERRLMDAYRSDSFSEAATAWNEERNRVVHEALEQHLIPAGVKWAREYLREVEEDFLADRCAERLRARIDVAPFQPSKNALGEVPSVLAVSWGHGDPHKDAITMVYLDHSGRMREHVKVDNLMETEFIDEFVDVIGRRAPGVIVVSGFSMRTTKLKERLETILSGAADPETNLEAGIKHDIPVIYANDEVARLYQHSSRAEKEFSSFSSIMRYCVGLGRSIQNPLLEFAALKEDIKTVSLLEDDQHHLPREKLLTVCEHVLVDMTNLVGVDVNRAMTDEHYQCLLPYVCGLGPRKAQVLVNKISAVGGTVSNRTQFVRAGILTTKIFLNSASFLRIVQDLVEKQNGDDALPDPLDDTRIHPEDYELARKMATDALELDDEDYHDKHASYTVGLFMEDQENERKIADLNLDEFAATLSEGDGGALKRYTLDVIREELVKPYGEKRRPWQPIQQWDVITMLSGESFKTLRPGLIISVRVGKTAKTFVNVSLDSGLEGIIEGEYLADIQPKHSADIFEKGRTIPALVVAVNMDAIKDGCLVELSARAADMAIGDARFRRVRQDEHWNEAQYQKDIELVQRKKRAEVNKTRRVIKHPNFHNFNSAQAEAYLEDQQPGDVVIRPSSKGLEHLAVTWKVEQGLYQHIDVKEPGADPTGQRAGGQLIVDQGHMYADLDELIVNHVQAMARRVEELKRHDRFKYGSEDELHLFLKDQLAMNPAKSMYGFALNRKRPGHFNLCFLANKNSYVQTWPVRVTPEAYYLFEAAAVGVQELCDAFKVRHLHESQNASAVAASGKTPYGAGGGRTPARPVGGATPGHASVRQPARTPNVYAAGRATPNPYGGPGGGRTPNAYAAGGRTPNPNLYGGVPPPAPSGPPAWGATPTSTWGGDSSSTWGSEPTPAFPNGPPPPPPTGNAPPGMNPERAALINSGGNGTWGSSGWS